MASRITEKKFLPISPKNFITDGDECGLFQVLGACQFRVGQIVVLKSDTQDDLIAKIVRIPSDTEIIVGDRSKAVSPGNFIDITDYLAADNATVELRLDGGFQSRPTIPPDDIWRAVYEEEPVIALRTVEVDKEGNIKPVGGIYVDTEDGNKQVTGEACPEPDGRVSAHVAVQNDAFTKIWDDIEVTARQDDGQPTELTTRKGGVNQQIGTIEYFDDGEFKRLTVTDA